VARAARRPIASSASADLSPRPQPALRHHRDGSARRGPELAGHRLQGQPDHRRDLLTAGDDADNLDVRALVAKDQRYIKRCIDLNDGILAHVSTANVARDIDLLRQSLGEDKITYFGYSYGTFLGATYASMFPTHYRAMVLDGPVDANAYINDPMRDLSAQTSGFERALGRFMQACAADHAACRGFPKSGSDPWDAYDALIDNLNASPLPVGSDTLDGDDVTTGRPPRSTARPTGRRWPRPSLTPENGDGALMKALSRLLLR
jgi:pimeloyl-ACP methyl ester carboxylesterase